MNLTIVTISQDRLRHLHLDTKDDKRIEKNHSFSGARRYCLSRVDIISALTTTVTMSYLISIDEHKSDDLERDTRHFTEKNKLLIGVWEPLANREKDLSVLLYAVLIFMTMCLYYKNKQREMKILQKDAAILLVSKKNYPIPFESTHSIPSIPSIPFQT